MQMPGDELIAARPSIRALAGLLCLLGFWAVAGVCSVIVREQPSGWDWLIIVVGFVAGVAMMTISGFVAARGRGPRSLLRWISTKNT